MEQVDNQSTVQQSNRLLADPINSMLQTFQNLSEDWCQRPAASIERFPKVIEYESSKLPCLVYEVFNRCPNENCELFHGQRCEHCYENVLPMWNVALRNNHTVQCKAKIQELRRVRNYEQTLSWLQCTSEDDKRCTIVKNKQWY